MLRNYRATYPTGGVLVSIAEDGGVVAVVGDVSGPFTGEGMLVGSSFSIDLALIGGLPPTARLIGAAEGARLEGAISAALELREIHPDNPWSGSYSGSVSSMVNAGTLRFGLAIDTEGRLTGEIATPSGPLVMEGAVSRPGLASVTVQGRGSAAGQTGTLFGNFLPSLEGLTGQGVYTGGGGDYGTWNVAILE